ncbi:MAG: RNA-binding transcriptional accessory protein, partial [Acidaminococcaceae bacterium]|nr:RNA-binding transcriptional accessory protein [Acidaminococcaceae bacterium]
MEKIVLLLAKELNIKPAQAEAALQLLDDGNTVPFIARYRKEATGSLDEEQIRNVETRAQYLRNLDARREEILNSIREQEKLTPELEQQIMAAEKMQVLEDLYLPYRPKKRTRAQIAREKGLEPLASFIVLQADTPKSLAELAAPFINAEKGVETESDAWKGAQDIVAENISDRADVRALIRRILWQNAQISSVLATDEVTGKDFLMYKEYSEPVKQLPPHRTLALNRGEKLKYLKLALNY